MTVLKDTISAIAPQDAAWREKAHARLTQLTMPHWALGQLMDLAEDLAGMTRSMQPPVGRRCIVTMAADHGIVAQGVSCFPQEVTAQMIYNFVRGGAGINALARASDAEVKVVDMGVAAPLGTLAAEGKILDRRVAEGTADFSQGPAMTRAQAVQALESGIEVAQTLGADTDLFGTGEMGIGNTTPSTAICAVMTGLPVAEITGRGTGIDDEMLRNKIKVIEQGIACNQPDAADAIDVLAKVGGFEIGGLAGLILGVAQQRKPVLVDGLISTAAALIAQGLCPAATDYMISAHKSVEVGHCAMLQKLGKTPLIDLGFRLGEGTGAAVAMHLVECAMRILTEVHTFEEASVSEADA